MEEEAEGGLRLSWKALDGGVQHAAAFPKRRVKFIWDLPQGRLREILEPVLEMRALMPLFKIRGQNHTLRIVNGEEKTVVRLVLEENRIMPPRGNRTLDKNQRLLLEPLKGYDKPFMEVRRWLEEEFGPGKSVANQYREALAAVGLTPMDYSSKLDIKLDPEARSDVSTKLILNHLLNAIETNQEGVQLDTDSEFLHDFRVAVRRTRSALGQIKAVIPNQTTNRFKEEFSWLGQITSPSRDMDVYLLAFDAYKESLHPTMRKYLEPLRGFLHAHKKQEYAEMAKAIQSPRYRKLIKNWRDFLERSVPDRPTALNANRQTLELAQQRIWRMYRLILKEGAAIGPESPAEALHELRKSCKKLRYLMEFFRNLFPKAQISKLIKTLKQFQENLGEFQDLAVQQEKLHGFERQMDDEGNFTSQTLVAMEMLVDQLRRRESEVRKEFADRFHHFSLPENKKQFKALFAQTKGGDVPAT